MPDLYRRAWDLRVGPLRIHGEGAGDGSAVNSLDLAFEVNKSTGREPNTATIRVWNLSPEHRAELASQQPLTVSIAAGYAWSDQQQLESGMIGTLFSGDVQLCSSGPAASPRRRSGRKTGMLTSRDAMVDVLTTIEAEDAGTAYRTATVSQSFAPGATVQAVLRYALAALGVGEGNLAEIGRLGLRDEIMVYANGTVLSGQAHRELDRVVRSCGLTWSVQGGALQLRRAGRALATTAIRLSAASGLIGSPTPDLSDGTVSATALLIPGLYPGRPVRLEARDLSGDYSVKSVAYSGDTAGLDWYAKVVLEQR